MFDDFNSVADEMPPTLEELEEDYNIPFLLEMFEAKEQGVLIMDFSGISVEALGLHERNCSVIFTYRDDIRIMGSIPLEGFQIDLIDTDTHESYLSAVHAISGMWPDRFDVSTGKMELIETTEDDFSDLMPADVMQTLTNATPKEDVFGYGDPGPYIN